MADIRDIPQKTLSRSVSVTIAAVRRVAALAEEDLRRLGLDESDPALRDALACGLLADEAVAMESEGDELAEALALEALRMAKEALRAAHAVAEASAPAAPAPAAPEMETAVPAAFVPAAPAPVAPAAPAPAAPAAVAPAAPAVPASESAPAPASAPAASEAAIPVPETPAPAASLPAAPRHAAPAPRHAAPIVAPVAPEDSCAEHVSRPSQLDLPDVFAPAPAVVARRPEPVSAPVPVQAARRPEPEPKPEPKLVPAPAPASAPVVPIRRPKAAKRVCAALAVVLVVLVGLVGAAWWGFFDLPEPVQRRIEILPDAHARQGRLNATETDVAPGGYQLVLNQVATMAAGTRTLPIAFENPAANAYSSRLELSLDGEALAKTGMVEPGFYVDSVDLARALPLGEHELSATVFVYSGATQINTMSATVTVRVK